MLQCTYDGVSSIMPSEAYFREQAARYFRIARAKSDPKMAARLEAMAREFLERAEAVASQHDVIKVSAAATSPAHGGAPHGARA
jgi:hypothetical protein